MSTTLKRPLPGANIAAAAAAPPAKRPMPPNAPPPEDCPALLPIPNDATGGIYLAPPDHCDEGSRMEALRELGILDTPPEMGFDNLAKLAARMTTSKTGLVSIVDAHRQWFKAAIGLDACETPRSVSFCGHAILQDDVFVVEDALTDKRFEHNPLVQGAPYIRFYAGMPVYSNGHPIGTLCVLDDKPHAMSREEKDILKRLAYQTQTELQLRQQVNANKALLQMLLPEPIVERLQRQGTGSSAVADVLKGRVQIAESHADATVLFCDMVGFTAWSRSQSPERVVEVVSSLLQVVDTVLTRTGCTRIKSLGDGVLIVGGVPEPDADHCRHIIETAIQIRESLPELNQRLGTDIQMRFGAARGPLVAGFVGSKSVASFDVFGIVVNLASRFEGLSAPNRILVTESVARTLQSQKNAFRFIDNGPRDVKGIGTMTTFLVEPEEDV